MELTINNDLINLKKVTTSDANLEILKCSYGIVIWIKPNIEDSETWIRIPEKMKTGIIFEEVKK